MGLEKRIEVKIDRTVEDRTRDMLGHAMRGELEEIPPILQDLGQDRLRESLNLCVLIAGYIAIDVCGSEWPTDAALQRIAENTVRAEKHLDLKVPQVRDYLARTALRFEPLDQVFPEPTDAVLAPILITGSLLLTFCPKDKDQWAWLDEIEAATEAAAVMKPYMYPAVILRARIQDER